MTDKKMAVKKNRLEAIFRSDITQLSVKKLLIALKS